MRQFIDRVSWVSLAVLILTVLILNIYLILHYRIHHQSQHPAQSPELVQENLPQHVTNVPSGHQSQTDVSIPKIIHVMWAERLVPFKQLQYVKLWRELHPHWTIYFWTTQDFDKLLQTKYPHLIKAYRELKPHDQIVSRRYFIIHHYGGVYADLDVQVLKPLDALIENKACILSQEPEINGALGWRIELMIGSAIFACRPRHPYFELVLNLLLVNAKDSHTLAASGSVMLSRVYFRYRDILRSMNNPRAGAVDVADSVTFMPYTSESYLNSLARDCGKSDGYSKVRKPFCEKYKPLGYKNPQLTDKSFTVHHWFRSWTKPSSAKLDKSTTSKRDIFEWMKIDKPPI